MRLGQAARPPTRGHRRDGPERRPGRRRRAGWRTASGLGFELQAQALPHSSRYGGGGGRSGASIPCARRWRAATTTSCCSRSRRKRRGALRGVQRQIGDLPSRGSAPVTTAPGHDGRARGRAPGADHGRLRAFREVILANSLWRKAARDGRRRRGIRVAVRGRRSSTRASRAQGRTVSEVGPPAIAGARLLFSATALLQGQHDRVRRERALGHRRRGSGPAARRLRRPGRTRRARATTASTRSWTPAPRCRAGTSISTCGAATKRSASAAPPCASPCCASAGTPTTARPASSTPCSAAAKRAAGGGTVAAVPRCRGGAPRTPHPAPRTPHPAPRTPHPAPHPAPRTAPSTRHPAPHPAPDTRTRTGDSRQYQWAPNLTFPRKIQ